MKFHVTRGPPPPGAKQHLPDQRGQETQIFGEEGETGGGGPRDPRSGGAEGSSRKYPQRPEASQGPEAGRRRGALLGDHDDFYDDAIVVQNYSYIFEPLSVTEKTLTFENENDVIIIGVVTKIIKDVH